MAEQPIRATSSHEDPSGDRLDLRAPDVMSVINSDAAPETVAALKRRDHDVETARPLPESGRETEPRES